MDPQDYNREDWCAHVLLFTYVIRETYCLLWVRASCMFLFSVSPSEYYGILLWARSEGTTGSTLATTLLINYRYLQLLAGTGLQFLFEHFLEYNLITFDRRLPVEAEARPGYGITTTAPSGLWYFDGGRRCSLRRWRIIGSVEIQEYMYRQKISVCDPNSGNQTSSVL
jgi:hypothetical protein